ncbi:chemotaxis protein CheA [Paenibacillus selenitireducens]|uniref:Chemotaxis protein CheA n=1 Tax=Paenibacillus selenitireducens TaxID=1324314 RepID=A0A1T2XCH5_9BACL|nr:chemotaxis protein CheA [Paenibacillus selenitireducens]OPA77614.1 chemotaxis protein CheA [Paenibacillus selenitireducens]
MEMNQYLSMFIDESNDHLQSLNDNMMQLESNPEDISIVQVIFRSAHTLKGMSATMGFNDLASLTHQMENVLDLVRNNELKMNEFIFDTLFKSLDALENMVQDITQGGEGHADVTSIVEALQSIVRGDYGQAAAASVEPAAASNQNTTNGFRLDQYQYSVLEQSIQTGLTVFYLDVVIREDCVLKGVRAYMVFDALEQNGEVVKTNPSVQDIEQEKFDRSFSIYYISKIDQASLHQLISSISEIESVHILPVDNETLIHISQEDDEVNEATTQMQQAVQETAVTVDIPMTQPAAPASTPTPARTPSAGGNSSAQAASRTIRVDIDRLDVLMNLFSELLIDRVRLEQLASDLKSQDLTETVEHMARVSGDLQNIVLKLRMVPIDTVFNRFPRMIRDLAKSLDKKVDFVITGADTELDRTVIEEIGDPLVHLLRNAVDHGLESIADRVSAGKSDTGMLQLRAFHSGNHVFIEIEDDGQGINREKVLKIAIKNGVISSDEAKSMTDEQVYQLLFAAGFSTADKVSDISGRGVGLDVVKSKILSLGGNVSVDSNWGKGSKFSVQLPLTLSIISAMLVRVGDEKYALPLSSIVETVIIERKQIRHVHGTKMIDYRQSVIPIVSLAEIFDCPTADEEKESTEVVVIRKGDRLAAFMVDDFIGQSEIVLKSLGKYLTNIHGISGATILGDGQVALIIDPNALVK